MATFWHGLLGFDAGGRPITPVYMWADTRSFAEAQVLRAALDDDAVHARTGCHLHSSYWPAKLRWLARERPAEASRVARWGSFGEFLELSLFGEATTSVSMASGTGLIDQKTARWDVEAAGGRRGGRAAPLSPVRSHRASTRPARPVGESLARAADRELVPGRRRRGRQQRRVRLRRSDADCPERGHVGGAQGGDPRSAAPARAGSGATGSIANTRSWEARPPEGGNIYAWCRRVLRLGSDEEIEAALAALPPDGARPHDPPAPGRGAGAGMARRAPRSDQRPSPRHERHRDRPRRRWRSVALRLAAVYDLLAPCASAGHAIVASGAALGHSARLDPDHRGCNRSPYHLFRRARGDQPRRRACSPWRHSGFSPICHRPRPPPGRPSCPIPHITFATEKRSNASAGWTRGYDLIMASDATLTVCADPAALAETAANLDHRRRNRSRPRARPIHAVPGRRRDATQDLRAPGAARVQRARALGPHVGVLRRRARRAAGPRRVELPHGE